MLEERGDLAKGARRSAPFKHDLLFKFNDGLMFLFLHELQHIFFFCGSA
tara:strand:+ start:293 stop:439 length:147 start_codon:yes stop_codon:yes gene_type:complete